MPKITIGTDVVNFPDNGSDALWSPAVIQFAELVETALLGFSNPYDISPTVFELTTNSGGTFDIGAEFNPVNVRKFSLNYSIYRVTNTISIVESGILTGSYNTETNEWILQDEYSGNKQLDGTAYHSFSISGNKVYLTTIGISGVLNPNKKNTMSFSAKTELVELGA